MLPMKPRRLIIVSIVWIGVLIGGGGTLVVIGMTGEHCCELQKLFISIGLILLMCAVLFASFFLFDSKSLRKYTMHVLIPWFVCSMLIFLGIIIAFVIQLINFKLFLITSLPVFSLGVFVFGEIFHYVGRMRVRPLHLQLKEIAKGGESKFQTVAPSSSQASWTSRYVSLHSYKIGEDGENRKMDSSENNHSSRASSNNESHELSLSRVTQAFGVPETKVLNETSLKFHYPIRNVKPFFHDAHLIHFPKKCKLLKPCRHLDVTENTKANREQLLNRINRDKSSPVVSDAHFANKENVFQGPPMKPSVFYCKI